MATPCRGDCEAGGMIQLVFYCRVRRLAVNPSVGVRRQLPLHKGGPVAGRPYCLCFSAYNRPSAGAQYGSGGTPPAPCKNSKKWPKPLFRHAQKAFLWEGLLSCTLPGLHPGPFRVMVYHTRSNKAGKAFPPETGTAVRITGPRCHCGGPSVRPRSKWARS